jgi:signal transduction histidine kinase
MTRLWTSVAFRLALGYGILVVASMSVTSAVFYFGTVGVLSHNTDAKLIAISSRLADHFRTRGAEALREEIDRLLDDGVDQDTEVYLFIGPDGRKLAGNLSGWTPSATEAGDFVDRGVIRYGWPSVSRLWLRRLPNGGMLVVGRDMRDRREIESLVWRALVLAGGVALLLASLGALVFRRRIEARIATIRRIARDIEAGDLSRRIPVGEVEDEFARLGHDINHMLDRIERLMDGVRHVSNAIAHDLRTPLGRIRGALDEALRPGGAGGPLVTTARSAIRQIDALIRVFDRLLQIAEAESGARRLSFAPVRLGPVAADVVELYDAAAEERGIALLRDTDPAAATLGDRNLLASALANLIDNALKYAGRGARVRVRTRCEGDNVAIIVEDDGPGIPAAERLRVVERFYRLDASRNLPGSGLGLSIVAAVASLHRGAFTLEDAAPGLRARVTLPRVAAEADRDKPLQPGVSDCPELARGRAAPG